VRVLLAGLPGVGKSTLAEALASRTGAAVLNKDLVRAAMFSPPFLEYSVEQDDFVLDQMIVAARWLEQRHAGVMVIFDGRTFSRRYQRDRVQASRIIECVCPDEIVRQRLEADTRHVARNRTFALYLETKARFEPITEPKLVVRTDRPIEQVVAECLPYLESA
jgi:predicted kinase